MTGLNKKRLAAAFLGGRVAREFVAGRKCGLRVLAYHRVLDNETVPFQFDEGVISAGTRSFRDQLAFVRANFDVLSFSDLRSIEERGGRWPERGLIVTFDDGYRDNYTNAFPILKEMGLPATVFLTTGHIGATRLFWWDLIAYYIKQSRLKSVALEPPCALFLRLETPAERDSAIETILKRVKRLPDEEKNEIIRNLPARLEVEIDSSSLERMHLNWDEVREMSASGMEFGSHTVSHPVLANVQPQQVETELVTSKREIERQLGRESIVFSYPVGGHGNFTPEVKEAVARAGYLYAVSYIQGLAGYRAGHGRGCDAYAIPRIHVEAAQSLSEFRANLSFPRLMFGAQSGAAA
ncbi:MAG TPA: polysaccharide deacetylase family protein [Blastocatellia bacterium]|nr:polysaccharide deacetylase family protein [Blastocatellia bacterium]